MRWVVTVCKRVVNYIPPVAVHQTTNLCINHHETSLNHLTYPLDSFTYQLLQRRLLIGERHIRQHLIHAVAHPLRCDVACDHERVRLCGARREREHSGVQSVGQAIGEECSQIGVFHARGEVLDQRVDDS
jgi:hypothetical protein